MAYVKLLNSRIADIINKLNPVIHQSVAISNLDDFLISHLHGPVDQIQKNDILPLLNNQGRRPEHVLFSWMRGHVLGQYFKVALARILDVKPTDIKSIGDDNWRSKETFLRTPKADYETKIRGVCVRIEVQSGFQGINDVKQHKVNEALRLYREYKIPTLCMHADIFNGQVALIRLDTIRDNDTHWITRQQMEGQTVFNIDQNYFSWRIIDAPSSIADFEIDL